MRKGNREVQRERHVKTRRHAGRMLCEGGARQRLERQLKPRNWWWPRRGKGRSFSTGVREHGPADTLISDLRPPELRLPSSGPLS